MATPEEKLSFLNNIPETATTQSTDAQQKLHELLLSDTKGGKLYKYRTVNKKNLKCLEDGTLYCALPSSFNDPFDCKIGYTFHGLYDAKFGTELDRFSTAFGKYISVLDGNLSLSDCLDSEKPLIEKLLKNKRLSYFFGEICCKAKTQEEVSELTRNNSFVIPDILTVFMEDESFAQYLSIMQSMLPKLLESIQPDGILKQSSDNLSFDDFAAANGITDDADEVDKVYLLTNKIAPEKAKETDSVMKTLRNGEMKVSDKMLNLFRIGCLATDFKNRLMWSHYANSHKGFCIEYDFSGTDSFTMEHLPMPIFYSTERPLIPWKAAIENTPENVAETSKQIMVGLLTKDKAWEYENEWRILILGTSEPLIQMPPISCIYLGANINIQNKGRILKIAREKDIPVKQMTVDRGAYKLHAKPIS